MDPSILYMLAFFLCVLLSWYLCKNFFLGSGVQEKFSDLVNSVSKFVFGMIVMLLIPIVMVSTNHFASTLALLLFVVLTLLVVPNLNQWHLSTIGIVVVVCFLFRIDPSIIEPFYVVIVGSILFQAGFEKMRETANHA